MASKPAQEEHKDPERTDSVSKSYQNNPTDDSIENSPRTPLSVSNLNDRRAAALAELATVAELQDEASVSEHGLCCLVKYTGASFGIITAYDDETDGLMTGLCCRPESLQDVLTLRFKLSEHPFTQSAFTDRKTRILSRLTKRHPFSDYLTEFAVNELAIVPLIHESHKTGAVYLGAKTGTFCDASRDFLNALAPKIAAMFYNARLLHSLQRQADYEKIVTRLTQATSQSSDLEQALELAVEELTTGLQLDRSQILVFERNQESAKIWSEFSLHQTETQIGLDFSVRGNVLLNAAADKSFVRTRSHEATSSICSKVVVDSATDQALHQSLALMGKSKTRALISAPLVIAREVTGLLICEQFHSPRVWSNGEIAVVEKVATFAAALTGQVQLKKKLKGNTRRAEALFQAGNLINDSPDLDALLNSISSVMRDFLGASACYVLLLDTSGENLLLRGGYSTFQNEAGAAYPLPNRLSATGTSLAAQALMSRRMVYLEDTMGEAVGSPINSAVAFPIGSNDRVYGALVIESDRPAIFDADDLKLLSSFARNLTGALEQARLFKLLASATREWEATFDSVADAVFIYDEFGRITKANIAALRLANESWPELHGRYDWRCDKWVLIDQDNPVKKALETKTRCETEAVLIDGPRSEFFHIDVDPVIDEQGRAVGAIEILRDLTELKLAEQKAVEQRNFFESLVENAFDAIFTVDLEGKITWFNNRTPVLTGYDSDKLLGLVIDSLVSSDAPVRMGFFFNEISKGRPQIFETRIVRPDGDLVDLMITGAPVLDGEKVTCSIVVARDITQQKRVSERMTQSDKLRALGELASGVAHDFNNILSVILGRAQLLQSRVDDERDIKDSEVILRAAIDGSRIVKRIQNFARVRADHDFTAVDLNKIVKDAVGITRTRWKHEAERQGIIVKVTMNLATAATVSGDPSELREVLVNLIFNAVDAMPKGGEIKIETESDEMSVKLTIADTGTGIDEMTRSRIFDPFFTTKGVSGTGLGLSVSYGIIIRHNGTIEVESEVGKGTMFTITFPVHHDVQRSRARSAPLHSVANILVVDDELSVRELLADTLESANYTVLCSGSGEEAIEIAKTKKPDLVLTDLGMPGMNGWEVAKTMKLLNPELPVIMITGWGVELEPRALQASGVDLVINKPFDLKGLLNSIDSQLQLKNASRGSRASNPAEKKR
ncbi:MAG TPA: GAF domain-containing protein [Blastocatellia bacterium]|nr:GAF domain-containing protein [Blastocatellia bacterium]